MKPDLPESSNLLAPELQRRFRLLEELSRSDQTLVAVALDLRSHQRVVLKQALGEYDGILAEGRRLQQVKHAAIVPILEASAHYLVLPEADCSWADILSSKGPLRPYDVVYSALSLCDAVQALHDERLLHLDIKPSNILVHSDGLWLSDLGAHTGDIYGTPVYMAPEQQQGGEVNEATDQHALACTLFEMITKNSPVDLALSPSSSPRWSDVPKRLRPILQRAVHREKSERYPSMTAFADELAAALPELVDVQPVTRTLSSTPVFAGRARESLEWEEPVWVGRRVRPAQQMLWLAIGVLIIGVVLILAGGPFWGHFKAQYSESLSPVSD